MALIDYLNVRHVEPLIGYALRLTLTDGAVVERSVARLLRGPVFGPVREIFDTAHEFMGGVAWDNGADISPDVLIWGDEPRSYPAAEFIDLDPPRVAR